MSRQPPPEEDDYNPEDFAADFDEIETAMDAYLTGAAKPREFYRVVIGAKNLAMKRIRDTGKLKDILELPGVLLTYRSKLEDYAQEVLDEQENIETVCLDAAKDIVKMEIPIEKLESTKLAKKAEIKAINMALARKGQRWGGKKKDSDAPPAESAEAVAPE